MPTEDETSISMAVASEGEMYSTPPRQVSPCPPPTTEDVIPEPIIDSYEFGVDEQSVSTPLKEIKQKRGKKRKSKKDAIEPDLEVGDTSIEGETKPPKPKKTKKRKKKIVDEEPVPEIIEPPLEELVDDSTKVSQTTDLDDATQESSQCDSSAMESSTGKGSAKKEKVKREKTRGKPKIKNKSPKKKLPKLALKFSKNKKKRRLGSGSPDHSDLERTPPPSPDDTESGIQKRRSARNTKRQKYTDDIEIDLSEEDDSSSKKGDSGILTPLLDSNGKPVGDGTVLSVVANINEDTMVVEKIMTSRMAQRELELEEENNADATADPNAKPQTIEVEEYFVKYKNLSYFHCEWRTEEELEKGDRRIGQKIKRFKQKKDTLNMFDFLDEEPYNPDYVEVDRILDVNEIEEIIEPVEEKEEIKVEEEIKDDTDSQTETQTIETDKSEPNSAESSVLVPNDSEKTEDISDTNDTKDKSEEDTEKGDEVPDEKSDPAKSETKDESESIDAEDDASKVSETDTSKEINEEKEIEKEVEIKEEKEIKKEKKIKETKEPKEEKPKPPVQTRKVKHYLVKWRALAYEDSTWELEDDLDPIKVEQFYRFRKPPPKSEWKPKRRPKPSDWKKIPESPVYKSGNTLREYQLEGLNWLNFCWYNG